MATPGTSRCGYLARDCRRNLRALLAIVAVFFSFPLPTPPPAPDWSARAVGAAPAETLLADGGERPAGASDAAEPCPDEDDVVRDEEGLLPLVHRNPAVHTTRTQFAAGDAAPRLPAAVDATPIDVYHCNPESRGPPSGA